MKIVKNKPEFKPYSIMVETEEDHKQLRESLRTAICAINNSSMYSRFPNAGKSTVEIFLEKLFNEINK